MPLCSAPIVVNRSPERAGPSLRGAAPRRGVSLLEMTLVIVVIGIIGAIVVPRFSRGADGAAEAVLADDLATLHKAAELFATEHGGRYPSGLSIINQLTLRSDEQGACATTASPPYIYGPYLKVIPAMPMGPHKGERGVGQAPGAGVAWIYDDLQGGFKPNLGP